MKQETLKRYSLIFKLSWPAIIEFALQMAVSFVDLFMVKSIGQDATAIIGVAAQVNMFVKFPIGNMNIGVLAFVAKNLGEGNYKQIRKASMQAIYLALAAGIFITIVIFLLPFPLTWILQLAPSLHEGFRSYFLLSNATLAFYVLSSIISGAFRGIRKMKTPMLVNVGINLINIILNFIFIYPTRQVTIGKHIFTIYGANLGLNGAALGTGISIFCGGIMMLILLWRDKDLSIKGNFAPPNGNILKQYVRVSIPSAASGFINGIGRLGFTSLISAMGVTVTAAHTIAFQLEGLCYAPITGLINTVTTLSGNALGAGDARLFKDNVKKIGFVGIVILAMTAVVMYLVAYPASALFSNDADVIQLSGNMLRLIAFSEPFFALALIIEGSFQGLGDTKRPFVINNVSMFLYRIFVCYFVTQKLQFGLAGAWGCMIADNVTRAIAFFILFQRKKWMKMFPNQPGSDIIKITDNRLKGECNTQVKG